VRIALNVNLPIGESHFRGLFLYKKKPKEASKSCVRRVTLERSSTTSILRNICGVT